MYGQSRCVPTEELTTQGLGEGRTLKKRTSETESLPHIRIASAAECSSELQTPNGLDPCHQTTTPEQSSLHDLMLQGPMSTMDAVDIFATLTDALVNKAGILRGEGITRREIIVSRLDHRSISFVTDSTKIAEGDNAEIAQPAETEVDRIYKVGNWLFESITGHPLVSSDRKMIENLGASVPAEIMDIVLRCVDSDISRRYGTMAEVRRSLSAIRDSWNNVRPKSRRLDKWTKLRLVLWVILGLIGALVLLLQPVQNEPTGVAYHFPVLDGGGGLYIGYIYPMTNEDYQGQGQRRKMFLYEERKKRDLSQYPPDALVRDIVNRHNGRTIYHSDEPVSRALLMQRAIQSGVSLRSADLHHVVVDTGLSYWDAYRITGQHFRWSDDKHLLPQFTLKDVDLRDALLSDCRFVGVDLTGCDFRGATISRTEFKLTNQSDASRFGRCHLKAVHFLGNVSDAIFDGATMLAVTFDGGGLNVSFKNCSMKIVSFKSGTYEDCDFSGAKICHGNFRGTDLRRSKFCGAILFRCDLSGADVTDVDHDGLFVSGCRRTSYDRSLAKWSKSPAGWVRIEDSDQRRRKPELHRCQYFYVFTADDLRALSKRKSRNAAPAVTR
jgi:uncharacterized protein YjbI with pentapeptide repeats